MKQETKILPVALTEQQRSRLKTLAFDKCVAMTELVRWWIDEKWDCHVNGKGSVGSLVKSAEPVVTTGGIVKPTPPRPYTAPKQAMPEDPVVDIYSIERKNCGNCGDSFPVNLLEVVRVPGTTRSKSLCKSCIDNMRNGQ